MKAAITVTCRFCGEGVRLSGAVEESDAGLSFTTDTEGTRAGHAHQARHDAEGDDQ